MAPLLLPIIIRYDFFIWSFPRCGIMEPLYLDFNKTLEGELDRIREENHEDLREALLVELDIIQNIILNIY